MEDRILKIETLLKMQQEEIKKLKKDKPQIDMSYGFKHVVKSQTKN